MPPKILLLIRSLFLKNLGLLFFLISLKMCSQTTNTITEIHTDWKGYWKSNAATIAGNRPDDANNLLAFKWNSVTYSTGVSDNILNAKGLSYNPQKFRALKIQSLGLNKDTYILQGSMIDGQSNAAILDPKLAGSAATGAELASRLTDGSNGLSLGTGVANIAQGFAEFKIGTNNLNLSGINDKIPDLIVTQVAEPGNINQSDIFKFVDAAGKTVGNEISVAFTSVPAIGTYSLDLFKADGGANGFTPASTRDIRMLGLETSSFGITDANASQVDRFVVSFSGSSDCAFIAFNTNSLKFAELSLIKTALMPSCGKVGDIITYTFDIKNSGDVPITDIYITDPLPTLSIAGNHISSLAAKGTATITGTYKITAADVAAGKIVNSAKVTGTDPSLNIVEDISGTAYDNDIATTTILLSSPTIGTITNFSCNSLGKVVLNNLPASDSWTITQSGTSTATKSGSGTTFTMGNLAVGSYNFSVRTTSGCNSPLSEAVIIKDQSSTTYNGTWSNGLPDATKNVTFASAFPIIADMNACSCTINSGVTMTVPSGVTLNVTNALTILGTGSLTFNNSASLIQNQNTRVNSNSGNIFFKRNTAAVRRKDYTYWSSPVSNFTLHDLSSGTYFDKYYRWNPSTGWIPINYGADPMIQGVGYIVRAPESHSLTVATIYNATFIGVPNNGDVNVIPVGGKFNLIGNPYPSALDAVEFIKANTPPGNETIAGAVYFWTHNTPPAAIDPAQPNKYFYTTDDYAVLNLSGTVVAREAAQSEPDKTKNIPTGNIASGQGFFVRALTNTAIKFNNKMRVAGADNSQFFKTTGSNEKDRLWLNFKNNEGAFKQLLVAYVDGATNSWDNNYDATTYSASPYVDFYSVNETKKLTIQGRALPFENSDQVALGYKSTVVGQFTISIDHTEGLFNQQAIYLEDKATGIISDLRISDYSFATQAGTFADRFVLRYTDKTLGNGDFENVEDGILISVKNKTINVLSSKENIKDVTIFDITGKTLYNKKKISNTELQIQNLPSGNQVLLVKVVLENNATVTQKIIFQ
ncbi:T9SS sorting signal type C domain-containing protein [Flavobacterium bizetiae]|uniref:DUF7507 domain-containing protein n=1 Tax=Flavobacterium bizetiae TaxID=2704140 RepID=UPI0021E8CB7C|nr:T9SS sorting signal type C domain-containing protein [Flavobacterium bizetiae]UTN05091.1 T9SS sorting signal type C domain-containing protein [Flavobacterium bizetiae]